MELVANNLSCRRGGRMVFRDLSFRVAAGEAIMLRGPNGAGKSTLLRVMAGLLPASGGDLQLGDTSLGADRSGLQERVAYSGHLDAVKPALTVRQNLALWAGIFAADSGRIDRAMDEFGLSRFADRPVSQCSAGQKRRLGLARMPVVDRVLWLLDEPTVSLDAEASARVAGLIRDHCAAGGIAMVATHIDLGLADSRVIELQGEVQNPGEASMQAGTASDAFLGGDWT